MTVRNAPSPRTGVEAAVMAADLRPKRLSGTDRRAQLLEIASTQFAIAGLHGTNTVTLAKAAGISEPVLYLHFESKDRLFREAVEHNIEKRLRALDRLLAAVAHEGVVDCIERIAEATVLACVSDTGNAVLTNWALLQAPEYAVDLHRRELGCVAMMWERHLADRLPDARLRTVLSVHVVAIQSCLAYGFWLAVLRHSPQSAAPLAHQFASEVAHAARSAC